MATNDFSPTNKIGEGGFGSVYKVDSPSYYTVLINDLCSLENDVVSIEK